MTERSRLAAGFVAIVLLAIAVGVLGLMAAAPFVVSGWLDQEIDSSEARLMALRQQLAQEGQRRQDSVALSEVAQDASLLLEGETTGIAGANLQKMTNGLILEQGGAASSFQILPPVEDGNLMRIPMSLSTSIDIDALRDILHRLETGTPMIFVDQVSIRTPQNGLLDPGPNFLGPLDVTLQLSGFSLKNKVP